MNTYRGVLLSLFLLVSPAAANAPEDVPADHWAREAVEQVLKAELMAVHPGNLFMGNNLVSRRELAGVAGRLERLGRDTHCQDPPALPDSEGLEDLAVRFDYLQTDKAGNMRGRNLASRFAGARAMVTYLERFVPDRLLSEDTRFPDVPANHLDAANTDRVVASGIMAPYPDGTFRGTNLLSRYGLAATLAKLLEKEAGTDPATDRPGCVKPPSPLQAPLVTVKRWYDQIGPAPEELAGKVLLVYATAVHTDDGKSIGRAFSEDLISLMEDGWTGFDRKDVYSFVVVDELDPFVRRKGRRYSAIETTVLGSSYHNPYGVDSRGYPGSRSLRDHLDARFRIWKQREDEDGILMLVDRDGQIQLVSAFGQAPRARRSVTRAEVEKKLRRLVARKHSRKGDRIEWTRTETHRIKVKYRDGVEVGRWSFPLKPAQRW